MIRTSSNRFIAQGFKIFCIQENCINKTKNTIKNPKRYSSNLAKDHEFLKTDKFSIYSENEGYIRISPYEPITLPTITLDQYVWQNYRKWENKIAAICIQTKRQYTFAQLRDSSAAFAVRLQNKFKLKPRDVVAVCLPNIPEYPICVFGSLEAGQTVTTVNPGYTADEIARQIVSSGAKFIVGLVNNYETLKNACQIAKVNIPIACIRIMKNETMPPGAIDFFELIQTQGINFSELKPPGINIEDLAFLPYSSGTTGLPKGVMLTHRNITSNCEMIQTHLPFEPHIYEATDTHQDIIPCVLPFFHIYGLTVGMISKLKLGCKLTTLMKFSPDDFIKSLDEYKATMLHVVPPMVLFLTNNPKVTKENVKNLRSVLSGAAPVGALDAEKFLAKFPHVSFTQGYGLTETSPVVFVSPFGSKQYAAAGLVTPATEVKIVSPNDKNGLGLGSNQTGEIWVRGPQVMKGYLNNDEANKDIFCPNNWMRTGDIAYYDDIGYFYITDRVKELIKVKGFQVPPAELEELLRDHPKILDAAVVGIPHSQSGEVPKAFVVLRSGNTATEKEIQDYIKDKVIHYKRLEGGVQFINEIPKTVSGKILRRELKQKYCT